MNVMSGSTASTRTQILGVLRLSGLPSSQRHCKRLFCWIYPARSDAPSSSQSPIKGGGPSQPTSTSPSRSSSRGRRDAPTNLPPYKEWVKGIGKQRFASPTGPGPHWIADTPFPLNPSFHPEPPLPQRVRDQMWELHSSDPAKYTPRALSSKFLVNQARIVAILRLKALEVEWQSQSKPLQFPFQQAMEKLLGCSLSVNDKARRAEQEPLFPRQGSATRGLRGPLREEVAEHKVEAEPSVYEPALQASVRSQASLVASLSTGGPVQSNTYTSQSITQLSHSSADVAQRTRPTLTIVDVSSSGNSNTENNSYSGAGVVARNERRALKRRQRKERKRQRMESVAAPTATSESHQPNISHATGASMR